MASSINVNQNNNTVSLQDQNRKITISDNVHEKTVNITQPVTNVVNVATIGPQGPQGTDGAPASLSTDLEVRNITASGNISASGHILTNQYKIVNAASDPIVHYTFISQSGSDIRIGDLDNNDDAMNIKLSVAGGNHVFEMGDEIDGYKMTGGSKGLTVLGPISSSGTIQGVTGSFTELKTDQYIYHNGDLNTLINFTDDRIRFNAGGINLFGMHKKSSTPHQVTVNNGGNNVDFVVNDNNSKTYFRTDADTSRIGIGVGNESPSATLHVSGTGDTNVFVEGHITSSGNISSSGTGSFGYITTEEFIAHKGDVNTAIRFTDNKISLDAGGMTFFAVHDDDSAPFTATVNGGSNRINFKAMDKNNTLLLKTDSDEGNVNLYYSGSEKLSTAAGGVNITGNITASGNISASGTIIGGGLNINGTTTFNEGSITNVGIIQADTFAGDVTSDNNITIDANTITNKIDDSDKLTIKQNSISLLTPVTASGNISASGGTVTALSGSFSHIAGNSPITFGDPITFQQPVTMSGNISSSGNVLGANITALDAKNNTSETQITQLRAQQTYLFTLQTSSTTTTTIFSESIAGFTPDGTMGGGTLGVIYFSSQSANGIDMCGNNPASNPTNVNTFFRDVGSQITLRSTSSGKFVRVKVLTVDNKDQQFQYLFSQPNMITGSGGYPDQGDTVEMIWDNSAGVGTIQGTGITNADTTINKIDIAYRTSSGLYAPNIDPSFGDESPVTLSTAVYAIPFISKSADLTINNLTTVGNVSSSGTGSFGYVKLPNLPTSDPGVAGVLFTTQSAGTGGNLDGQKVLLVSGG